MHQLIVNRPLEISNVATSYDVKCSVTGGGIWPSRRYNLGNFKSTISHDSGLKDLKKIN